MNRFFLSKSVHQQRRFYGVKTSAKRIIVIPDVRYRGCHVCVPKLRYAPEAKTTERVRAQAYVAEDTA